MYLFSKYQEAADNLRENILSQFYNGSKAKDILIGKISEVIGDWGNNWEFKKKIDWFFWDFIFIIYYIFGDLVILVETCLK